MANTFIKRNLNPDAHADNVLAIGADDSHCCGEDQTVCRYQLTFTSPGITTIDDITIVDSSGTQVELAFANQATDFATLVDELIAVFEKPESDGGAGGIVLGGIDYRTDYPATGDETVTITSEIEVVQIDDGGGDVTATQACDPIAACTLLFTLAVDAASVPLVLDEGLSTEATETLTGPYPTSTGAALLESELETALTNLGIVFDAALTTVVEDVDNAIFNITIVAAGEKPLLTLEGNDYVLDGCEPAYNADGSNFMPF